MAESAIPESIDSSRSFVLREFLTNKDIRDCIQNLKIDSRGVPSSGINCLESPCSEIIKNLLDSHKIAGFTYACEICDNMAPCIQLPRETIEKSVYPGAVMIYFYSDNVKYVRVYFWKI